MLTRQKVAPRREIFSYAKEVYITFDANEKESAKFTLIFESEEESCSFAACLRNLLKEVDEKGYYNISKMVKTFADPKKSCGSLDVGDVEYNFTSGEGTDIGVFREKLAHEVWGDTSD